MIKLNIIKDESQYITPIPGGYEININGHTLHMANQGTHLIPHNMMIQAINDIEYPLEEIEVDILCVSGKLRLMRDDGTWSESAFQGVAFNDTIIYGGRDEVPTLDSIGELIIHEFGHMIMYDAFNCTYKTHFQYLEEYCSIRKAPYKDSRDWFNRPCEWWAEDFRRFFGKPYMLTEPFTVMEERFGVPTQEVKEYLLSLVPLLVDKDVNDLIEDFGNLGGDEDMILNDTKTHWAKDAIDVVSEAGLMNGFPDGLFHPDEPLTRAQMATILAKDIEKKMQS